MGYCLACGRSASRMRQLRGVPVRRQAEPDMQAVFRAGAAPARMSRAIPCRSASAAMMCRPNCGAAARKRGARRQAASAQGAMRRSPLAHRDGQARQPDSQMFILHGFQLGHFVSMYGNCFEVVCISTCSNTILAWRSPTFSPRSSSSAYHFADCHAYSMAGYNARFKQDARREWFARKLLRQRIEAVLLTIDSVK